MWRFFVDECLLNLAVQRLWGYMVESARPQHAGRYRRDCLRRGAKAASNLGDRRLRGQANV